MKKRVWVLLFAIVAFWLFGTREAVPMDLSQFQWKNRLILIFSTHEDELLSNSLQTELVNQKVEVSERHLVVFRIFETGPSFMDSTQIDFRTSEAIRQQLDVVPEEITCILVGKDGGVKLRRPFPVKLNDIFTLIDSMPMRQEEMRQKN
jgi:hypothetical protein